MKKTNKKLIGGLLMSIMLIATIETALATEQTDDTSKDITPQIPFEGSHDMSGLGPYASDLTDEQQAELEELTTTLIDQNATPEEIQSTILEKLDEYGVLDIRLDNEIVRTEQRLTILNREKELRDQGYSWDEIRNVIQEEFDLQNITGIGFDMMNVYGFE
jgi:DNA-binding transcriptional MerR regulator